MILRIFCPLSCLQRTTEGSPSEISIVVRSNEHQDRSGCSDTGLNRSPCYSFEVGYIFISSLLAHELPFTRFFLIRGEGEQFTSEEHQTGPFHSVRLVLRVNGDWSLQCPFYEHIVIKWGWQAEKTPAFRAILYICCSLPFDSLTFLVSSLVFTRGTSSWVIRGNLSRAEPLDHAIHPCHTAAILDMTYVL